MVAHAIKQPQFQVTPESSTAMENLVTVSRLRAALARITNLRLDRLGIQADGDTVVIRGRVKSQQILDSILDAAIKVPGVDTVKNEAQVDYRTFGVE